MPKIGKRILKSSLAVLFCFVIYLLRNEQGIVFYSCIAAVLCVQQNASDTINVARNRVEGTLIGGFTGMLVLLFEKNIIPHDFIIIQYGLISFMIIPIIYITVVLKKTSASYISCVVFMSVTVSHAMDVNPFMFAIDRIVDTLIGIFVALLINGIHVPFHHNKHILFYVELDALHLGAYEKIKLNQMMEHGAAIGFVCDDLPGEFIGKLEELNIKYPIVCFHGNVQYDLHTKSFINYHVIHPSTFQNIYTDLRKSAYTPFIYTIQYHMVHIYVHENMNEDGRVFIEQHRKQPYDHYIYGEKPKDVAAFAIMLYLQKEDAIVLEQTLTKAYQNITCIIKAYNHSMVQLFIVSKHHIMEELETIANHDERKTICYFQQQPVQTKNIHSSIQVFHSKNIMKDIRKRFYAFK